MAHIIVVGHGPIAPALLDTARMIVGPLGHATAVDFPVGTGVEDLTARVGQAVTEALGASDDEQVLILTDVLGGSPSRVGLTEVLQGRAEVVTGMNLPMLVEVLSAPETLLASDLAARATAAGAAGVSDLGSSLRQQGNDT